MQNMQSPKPGILPPNSPIVSNVSAPHIPVESTDPSSIDQGIRLPQDASGAGTAGAVPQVSEARQDLSGALLKLAGTFIGNALEEGLGDGTGKVQEGIAAFADAGSNLLKERWYKENASNFNLMVFKPFENSNKAAFADYNAQIDVINNDPNMAPEEKFAASRALQYKLSMTGKNLNLQLQMAAANPQFSSNPYVKNTMATLLNHQEGVINDLAKSYDVAMSDEKHMSDIKTAGVNQEARRLEGGAAAAQTRRFEQDTELAPEESRSKIGLQDAQAAAARDEGGQKRRKALLAGDLGQAESAEEALAAMDSNPQEQARIAALYKDKYVSESEQDTIESASKFQNRLEQEFSAWASSTKAKYNINDANKRPEAVTAFFDRKKLPVGSALKQFKDDPDVRMKYLAWLQYSGADPGLALAPAADVANNLTPGRKGNPLWDNYIKMKTRKGSEEAMETGVVKQTISGLTAGGRKDLADEVATGERGQNIGMYTPSEKLKGLIAEAEKEVQEAQQALKEEQATSKRPEMINGYKNTINRIMQHIESWTEKLEKSRSYEE